MYVLKICFSVFSYKEKQRKTGGRKKIVNTISIRI